MVAAASDTQRADHIYRIGPETLVAQSFAIHTGRVSEYSRRILEMSPSGPDGFALKWVISGRIDQPVSLKGPLPEGPVTFSRAEQSGMLPQPASRVRWEMEFGDLGREDGAVVFLQRQPAASEMIVLPTGHGDRDLATLVRGIVGIQAIADPPKQLAAWASYIERAPMDEGRRAALRSLIASPMVDWPRMEVVLSHVLANAALSSAIRAFSFGIVAFAVMHEKWGDEQLTAVDFLGRQFEAERDPRVALQQILNLKLVLGFASEAAAADARQPLRQHIIACLKRRAARAPLPPELMEQYKQVGASYPGEL
jgi:hypothetical protein